MYSRLLYIVESNVVKVNRRLQNTYLSLLSGFEPSQLQLHRVGNFHVDSDILDGCFANVLAADSHHSIALADLPTFQGAATGQLNKPRSFKIFILRTSGFVIKRKLREIDEKKQK